MSDTTIYFITPTSGDQESSFVIQPKTIDGPVNGSIRQHTDLVLYGNGAENWGEKFNQNFYRLLENFACPSISPELRYASPVRGGTSYGMTNGINFPIRGQLWYNTTHDELHVYTGSYWKSTGALGTNVSLNNIAEFEVAGASADQVMKYNGSKWVPYTLPEYSTVTISNHLADFNIPSSPSEGQILVFRNGRWTNENSTVPTVEFSDLGGSLSENTTLTAALDAKQNVITGAISDWTVNNFTDTNEILISNSAGKVETSGVAAQKLGFISTLTSNVQDQLDSKIDASSPSLDSATLTGTPTAPTAPTGTDSAQIATTAFVHDHGLGGTSQSYQYFAGCSIADTKMVNTTYTHTGKTPLYLTVQLWPTSAGIVSCSLGVDQTDPALYSVDQHMGYCANPFTVDPVDCKQFTLGSASDTQTITLQAIVPPGYKYRVNTSLSIATLHVHSWRELR